MKSQLKLSLILFGLSLQTGMADSFGSYGTHRAGYGAPIQRAQFAGGAPFGHNSYAYGQPGPAVYPGYGAYPSKVRWNKRRHFRRNLNRRPYYNRPRLYGNVPYRNVGPNPYYRNRFSNRVRPRRFGGLGKRFSNRLGRKFRSNRGFFHNPHSGFGGTRGFRPRMNRPYGRGGFGPRGFNGYRGGRRR